MKNANPFSKVSKWLCSVGVVLLLLGSLLSAQLPAALFNMRLNDSEAHELAFSTLRQNKASVLVFLSPECPLCQSYSLTIQKLQQQFQKDNIRFYGIIPDKSFSNAEVNAYRKQFHLSMPMLRDDARKVTRLLKATITPEVFVLNAGGDVLYSGRIDNWAYELGRKRRVITEHDLQDALQAIVKNTQPRKKKTEAIGCFIE